MRAAIVLLICLVASAPGDAGQCSDPALATREARSKSIQAQTDKIAKEINKVEPISPSQEKYFENEKKRLSADPLNYSDNLKRLETNPFYLAYKTR
jgi:hypothetical protein